MITVKEIARLAGVSPKTAERALSGATKDIRRDAKERAERVRRIAEAPGGSVKRAQGRDSGSGRSCSGTGSRPSPESFA